ncbi:TIGR02466 family protein [Azohydromonas sediminis]|uniref:TIGR02466 family protein n=1 Tax=Azohydromonas sediminis TaxID=2259674 RepID=UPI000E65E2A4|nr:TIGR02466 family protein [Azohydromonas sediminis]
MERLLTFATPIWVMQLADLAPQRERWVETVRTLRRDASPNLEKRSNRSGWRSANTLLDLPVFAPLQRRLLESIKLVLADYGVRPGTMVLNMIGWANVHDRGGFNHAHIHSGSILSGTFYLACPPGAGALYFTDPRPAALMEDLPLDSAKLDTPASRKLIRVQPRELQLVIFPSWLEHGVDECECDERISIAFNVQPVMARP